MTREESRGHCGETRITYTRSRAPAAATTRRVKLTPRGMYERLSGHRKVGATSLERCAINCIQIG